MGLLLGQAPCLTNLTSSLTMGIWDNALLPLSLGFCVCEIRIVVPTCVAYSIVPTDDGYLF